MALETFLALLAFAFVSSITPGPNNFMLLTSGANFGFRRTIPHMFGIAVGFGTLLLAVGFGLGALLEQFPTLHLVLKIAGGSYLLFLAWKIAGSRSLANDETVARPISLLQAAAFQWVNPKAWMMALSAMVLFTNPQRPAVFGHDGGAVFCAGELSERFGVGRLWHCSAQISVQPAAAEMVQSDHGSAADGDAGSDDALTADRQSGSKYAPEIYLHGQCGIVQA